MGSAKEDCLGYAARDPSGVLSPFHFSRRAIGVDDISISITHCGVCYGEVLWTRNKFGDAKYPLCLGKHEIVGLVKEVGSNVKGFKVGDHVGVGTYVNSCRDCEYCFKIPKDYPLALAAPLLCAGITVYSPMVRYKMNQPGKSLGVIGLGGLGHMAIKFGKAFGLNVTVFSTSISKKEEALNLLGADKFVLSTNQQEMLEVSKSLDFIIDTASGAHPFDPYMSLLKTGGVLVLVGASGEVKLSPMSLILGRKSISGSVSGGTKDTKEMLEFCAAKKIYPEIEVIPIQYVNEAIERLIKSDIKYRFVIDIENSLKHEIVGLVKEVGSNVKGFKVGDHVGGAVFTYNHVDVDGTITRGGFSTYVVVHERYCFKIPKDYPLASAAPLLCAGITVYSPMIRHKMNQPGKSLGVIGLGGLGHMAVKFGKAFGLNVTVFSTSISKKEEALNLLGADKFVLSTNQQEMLEVSKSLDFIIDTASGTHPFDPYMSLLKTGGVLVLVGAPGEVKLSPISLIRGMKSISGSASGGTKDTKEMLEFCAAKKIYPEIEIIPFST
ncbi:hypothetical protein C3L33_13222, partial [Rhododendron williamsianum]